MAFEDAEGLLGVPEVVVVDAAVRYADFKRQCCCCRDPEITKHASCDNLVATRSKNSYCDQTTLVCRHPCIWDNEGRWETWVGFHSRRDGSGQSHPTGTFQLSARL